MSIVKLTCSRLGSRTFNIAPRKLSNMPGKKKVELFYDIGSAYSWVGFEIIHKYQPKWNIDLVLKPFLLGAVMKATGNRPPAMLPSKGAYLGKELELMKKYYNIPFDSMEGMTKIFSSGKGSLSAQRFLTALQIKYPQYLVPVSKEFWNGLWTRADDYTEPEHFLTAGLAAGMKKNEIEEVAGMMGSQEVKDRLKKYTEEAIEAGAFGAPTWLVEGTDSKTHMLWGSDRFDLMACILGEKYEGPTPASKL